MRLATGSPLSRSRVFVEGSVTGRGRSGDRRRGTRTGCGVPCVRSPGEVGSILQVREWRSGNSNKQVVGSSLTPEPL